MFKCTTIKNGIDCRFMLKGGCGFNNSKCLTVVERCTGCAHIQEFPTGLYCDTYADPYIKWANGDCNFATHIIKRIGEPESIWVDPLKASKQKARKKKI